MSQLQLPEIWFNLDFTIKYLVSTICYALYWEWEDIINTYLDNTMTLKKKKGALTQDFIYFNNSLKYFSYVSKSSRFHGLDNKKLNLF